MGWPRTNPKKMGHFDSKSKWHSFWKLSVSSFIWCICEFLGGLGSEEFCVRRWCCWPIRRKKLENCLSSSGSWRVEYWIWSVRQPYFPSFKGKNSETDQKQKNTKFFRTKPTQKLADAPNERGDRELSETVSFAFWNRMPHFFQVSSRPAETKFLEKTALTYLHVALPVCACM